MTFKFLKIIVLGYMLSVSTLANAILIDNGVYNTDTLSGLDWLDWNETKGNTQAQAVADWSGDGWRVATASEAQTLMLNFFPNLSDYYNDSIKNCAMFGCGGGTDEFTGIMDGIAYSTIVGAG